MYLCLAAEKGSDWAAYWLGTTLADGLYDLSPDREEAIYWLSKSLLPCPLQFMDDEGKDEARRKLRQLELYDGMFL